MAVKKSEKDKKSSLKNNKKQGAEKSENQHKKSADKGNAKDTKKNTKNPPENGKKILPVEVTADELGEFLGVTGRRVRQLKNEGVVISAPSGHYDLKKSILSFINNIREKEKEKKRDLNELELEIEVEKLGHERLKKRKTQLIVEQMEKKLHYAEDVEFAWNGMCAAIKTRLTAIPVKATPELAGLKDKEQIKAILKREVGDALAEIAGYDIDMFDSEIEDDDDADTDEPSGNK